MRGTVLLLAGEDSYAVDTEHLRAHGLLVYEAARPDEADRIAPDVVVTVLSGNSSPSVIRELRTRVDHATSIIVVAPAASREDRDAARGAGADSILPMPAQPGDVLYEVQRALILRRSGRRLPHNRE
jgi:DNA-binding response OmpR family regulator